LKQVLAGTLSDNSSAQEFLSTAVPQIRGICESQKMDSNTAVHRAEKRISGKGMENFSRLEWKTVMSSSSGFVWA